MDQYYNTSRYPTNENSVLRPRIQEMMETAVQNPVVVVTGGAGFGKTEAVAGFLERSDYLVVWQELTMLDNLPVRFWESFVYSLAKNQKELAKKLELLGFPDTLYKLHKFMHLFTKEFFSDDRLVIMVFDNFHMIKEPSVYGFFQYLVSAHLEKICLLFITRKLNACYFKMRIHVINADDLRFTKNEIREYFISQSMAIPDEKVLNTISAYTGGWPLAVFLIVTKLQTCKTWDERDVMASQQMLFSLIENENFPMYRLQEQKFLVLLSMLNFLPLSLLAKIGTIFNIEALPLLRDCAFVSYDKQAESFYFHQIFLEFLKDKLGKIQLEERELVLSLAGDWCRENKYYADAMEYFSQCGYVDKIWDIILESEGIRHPKNEAALFISYIEKFPQAFSRDNVMRRIVYAMLLLNNLQVDKACQQMDIVHEQLEQMEDTVDTRKLMGEACIGSGLISLGTASFEFVGWFKKAAELLPHGSRRWGRKLNLIKYSYAVYLTSAKPGELQKGIDSFFEGMPYISKVLHGAGYGLEYLAAAEGAFMTGSLKEAEEHAYQCYYMAIEKDQTDIAYNALFLLLRVYLVAGNTANMDDILKRIESRNTQNTEADNRVLDIALGWFYSELGEVSKVADWLLTGEVNESVTISMDKEILLHLRCLLVEKNHFEALAILDKLEKLYRKPVIPRIYVLIYRAVTHYRLDNVIQAYHALEEAYMLAAGNHLVMPFIEYGYETRSLLGGLLKENKTNIPDEWLRMIHSKAATYAKRHSFLVSRYRSAENKKINDFGLSKRELELLRNMSQGLTREEAAASMYISPHTVKSMLKTIYNKMEAVNSADAVRIAVESKLI